jgi:hypothetical protein
MFSNNSGRHHFLLETILIDLLYNGYRVSPGGKELVGRETDPSPPSSAVVKKE